MSVPGTELTKVNPLEQLRRAVEELDRAANDVPGSVPDESTEWAAELAAFGLGVIEMVLLDFAGNLARREHWSGAEWDAGFRALVHRGGEQIAAAGAVAHSVREQLGATEAADRRAGERLRGLATAGTGVVLAWGQLQQPLSVAVVSGVLEQVWGAVVCLMDVTERMQALLRGQKDPSAAANLEVCRASLEHGVRALAGATGRSVGLWRPEVWRIVGADAGDVGGVNVARGVEEGRQLLAHAEAEIEARRWASTGQESRRVKIVVDESAGLLEDAAFRRELGALMRRPRSERFGFTMLVECRVPGPSAAVEHRTVAARVSAFEGACGDLSSALGGVRRAGEGPHQEWGISAYVLGEVEAAVWGMRGVLMALRLRSGATWSAKRRGDVDRACRRLGEAWHGVSKSHAALHVSEEQAEESVAWLGPELGVGLRDLGVAVREIAVKGAGVSRLLTDAEVDRVLGSLGRGVGALGFAVGSVLERGLLTMAEQRLFEAMGWMERARAATEPDRSRRPHEFDVVAQVRNLERLGARGATVFGGSARAVVEAAQGALWAVETVLAARAVETMGRVIASPPTGVLAAQIKLTDAAVALGRIPLSDGLVTEEAPVLTAMRKLERSNEEGSAVLYGGALRFARACDLVGQVATLGRAVETVAMAVEEAAGQCAPPASTALAAAAATARSAAEDLLQDEADGGRGADGARDQAE